MTDRPEDPSAETPIQRALRMKKAAQSARFSAPVHSKFSRDQIAGVPAGKSKPQLRK